MYRMIVTVFFAALAASISMAQPPQGPDPHSIERIERWKKMRLVELLNLNEDQSVRFFARMNDHDSARRELMKKKGESLDKIERLVRNRAEAGEFEKAF